jgi:4-amino-4-deoxy-L-arabinose transferase-like glycosyltransferase
MPFPMNRTSANSRLTFGLAFLPTFGALVVLHYPLLRLPYLWDEAGYYIPAALDFFRHGLLVPQSTLRTGHTPLVSICLAIAWRFAGFSPLVTRLTMVGFAAGTLVALYALSRTLTKRETAIWACILLGLSPLFFAQSTLALLDLPAAFTTTVAVWALLRRRMMWFAVAASLAVLTKETAVVIVPVAVALLWSYRKSPARKAWWWLAVPVATLSVWALYYHHVTGYWTGGATYLQYNLYSTLEPGRIAVSLLRRLYQVFVAGFNWLLVGAALLGYRRLKAHDTNVEERTPTGEEPFTGLRREFFLITVLLGVVYIIMLSVVGGAVLTRYLLPVFPCFYLALVLLVERLPSPVMRTAFVLVAACFVASWFINPPFPFAYENNLSYADFIRLHQQAAEWLSAQPGNPRVLTAWPATDELGHPELGYVKRPMRVVGVPGFAPPDFRNIPGDSFDLLYLYSRKWDPPGNWLLRYPWLARLDRYTPPIHPGFAAFRYNLHLVATFERRGQWVRIYAKGGRASPDAATHF